MRIALCTDTFPPEVNGVANTAFRSALSLATAGHEVCVFTVSQASSEELEKKAHGAFRVVALPSFGIPVYLGVRSTIPAGLALGAMRKFKPDIIHAHTPFSVGWEAVWASRLLSIPLVGTHHTFFNHYLEHVHLNYAWAERMSWKFTALFYNRCDVVISPTSSLREELLVHGLRRPCEIIQNGIDTEIFRPVRDAVSRSALKKAHGLSGHTLVHMGRLSYEKSIDQAIRAFAIAARAFPEASFLIIGDGPARESLQDLAGELGMRERVRFTGFLFGDTLVEMLQASDVFLTASKSENMPLAVLEAMACGLPILAVRSLGLSEMIDEGENGRLLAPDDAEAMAGAVEELFSDEPLRERFSASSRTLSATYSETAVTERLVRLYARVHKAPAGANGAPESLV